MSAADGLVRNEEGAVARPPRRNSCHPDHFTSTKVNPMKPTLHYQSQLLPRRSYKPSRTLRIKPAPRPRLEFRPVNRFGAKPQIALVP